MKEGYGQMITHLPRVQLHLLKIIAPKLMCSDADTRKLRPCTVADVIRELVEDWIDKEQSMKFFPIILKDFATQGVKNETTAYMRQGMYEFIQDYSKPKCEGGKKQLEILKTSMLAAGWLDREIAIFFEEALEAEKSGKD